ncbi:MAG: hypothetical protein AB1403_20580 [Candidatus Riflebacteria bacterium]
MNLISIIMYMVKRIQPLFLLVLMLLSLPIQSAEASFFSDALAKARKAMQGAFQMTWLPSMPVVFYKESFKQMFDHTQKSIDNISMQHDGQTITRDKFQDDKALHIKKSAELALHVKSLIGSAHLAYGITMAIGLIKEAIDGSFLNPNGSRSKEDVVADHVGAMAVFGEKKFDSSLQKNLGTFVKPSSSGSASAPAAEGHPVEPELAPNPFAGESVSLTGQNSNHSQLRQQLLKKYYEAAEKADQTEMQRLAAELQKLQP